MSRKVFGTALALVLLLAGCGASENLQETQRADEDLYNIVLSKYVTAVNENWDTAKFQMEYMSTEFSGMSLDSIGYAYADINGDGTDELFMGVITDGDLKGVALDIYTIVNGVPSYVASGITEYRYYNYENSFIANEWGDSDKYGLDVYLVEPNSTELLYQRGYKYDTFENADEPWFSSNNGEEYESISGDEFTDGIDAIKADYVLFDFKPLSENEDAIAGANVSKTSEDDGLPAYEYPGPELFDAVMYQYIVDEFGKYYDPEDVGIPCPIIVAEDFSDREDMKVWGIFQYYNYTQNEDTLECVSGGSYHGCMHFADTDAGYEVTGFDAVADGSDYDSSAKEIFGKYYDDLIKMSSDNEECERIRAQIIANYVAANDLPITKYKDYGWDPIILPKAKFFDD